MTHHLYAILAAGAGRLPRAVPKDALGIAVRLDVPRGTRAVGTNAWRVLDGCRLRPSSVAVELYRLAVLVYAADTRLSRSKTSDGWSRDVVIYLPVADPEPWERATPVFQDLLSFLTGDRWRLEVFQGSQKRPPRDKGAWRRGASLEADTVSLFSGGLDSFIGAVDSLAEGTPLVLVGHYEVGWTKKVQDDLRAALDVRFPGAARLLQFMVQPAIDLTGEAETTTRSRSFLFFSLATLVASGLGVGARIVIPENGFIALNAPLTLTRLGALSTRTAHPHTIHLFRRLLAVLAVPIPVETPYAFRTKGEMVTDASDRTILRDTVLGTMSCAHPTAGRWKKQGAFKHCGYCVPCIIRRSALRKAGWDRVADYRVDVLAATTTHPNLEDVRALLAAIARSSTTRSITDVLRAGPLSDDPDQVQKYLDVYRRGLREVQDFLDQRRTKRL